MIRIAIAAEDHTGAWIVRHLTDAQLCEIDWIERDHLDHHRGWLAVDGQPWLAWKRVGELCRQLHGPNFRLLQGRFDGKAGASDALMVRKTLWLLANEEPPPDIVLLARDDDQEGRHRGFRQAIDEFVATPPTSTRLRAIAAIARPEVEAWLIAAWQAESDDERQAHAEVRQQIGFDPVTRSHALTSTSASLKDCKRVLDRLTAIGRSAKDRFTTRSLSALVAAGKHNGLAEFLQECQRVLATLFGKPA